MYNIYLSTEFQNCDVEDLLNQILKHKLEGNKVSTALCHVCSVLFEESDDKVKKLFLSKDEDVVSLATQMMFSNHLKYYNILIKNQFYTYMLEYIIKAIVRAYEE